MNIKSTLLLLLLTTVLCHRSSHAKDHSHSHSDHSECSHNHKHQTTKEFSFLEQKMSQLKYQFEQNIPTKQSQVITSVLIVSFPSLPVFLLLSGLGKLFKSKGDKHNFSANLLNVLQAFGFGSILGDVLLHILPFLFEEEGHGHVHNLEQLETPLMIIAGIILLLVLDYIFIVVNSKEEKHEGHSHAHSHEDETNSAVPFLICDFLHNFTDGLALGAAYNVSLTMGLTSTFVIMIHELPHEIGDFAFLIKHNYGLTKIFQTQIMTSLGALVGGIIGLKTGEFYKKEMLSITAGCFIYTCLTTILPEIKNSLKQNKSFLNFVSIIIAIVFGVFIMYQVALME